MERWTVIVKASDVRIGDSVSLASASVDRPCKVIDIEQCQGITGECVKVYFAPDDYYVFNLKERVEVKR
jgi:hypothetical protein